MKREMNLLEIFQAIIKRASILLGLTIIFTVIGVGGSLALNKKVYTSTTSLIVGQESQQETGQFNKINGEPIYEDVIVYGESSISDQAKKFYSETLTRRDVLKEVINRLSLNLPVEELKDAVKMEVPENSSSLLITVNSPVLTNVDEIADELAAVFQDEVFRITEVEKIQVINDASEPQIVNTVSFVKNIIMAIVAALAIGVVLILVLEYLDDSVQSAKEIEKKLDLPIIGQIGKEDALKEDLKRIRTTIEYSANLKDKKVITVATIDSTYRSISSGLSDALVDANKEVLLIDGDFRAPSIQKELNLTNDVGLSNLLIGELDFSNSARPYRNSTKSHVLTTGNLTANPSEQLSSNAMKQLLADMKQNYDYVIVNGHPIKEVTDTVALSTGTDGIILVVKENETKMKELEEVQKLFNNIEVNVLGIILDSY